MVLDTPVIPVVVLFLGGLRKRVLLPFKTVSIWSRHAIAACNDLALFPQSL
jgi:hypothetical protein